MRIRVRLLVETYDVWWRIIFLRWTIVLNFISKKYTISLFFTCYNCIVLIFNYLCKRDLLSSNFYP